MQWPAVGSCKLANTSEQGVVAIEACGTISMVDWGMLDNVTDSPHSNCRCLVGSAELVMLPMIHQSEIINWVFLAMRCFPMLLLAVMICVAGPSWHPMYYFLQLSSPRCSLIVSQRC